MRAPIGRRDRSADPAAAALARPGARVHPRGRVRRGDAVRHPPAQGRALGAAAPDGGEPQGARPRARLAGRRPRRAAARPAGRHGRATGNSFHQTPATTTVATPPSTTAGTAPMSAAATPDSNAPSSFDALMKTISTAFTRPRSSSGVTSGRIVERRTTLTMSNAAAEREREHREPHRAREPEDDHADAEAGDDDEERRPGVAPNRVAGDRERREERADRRRRAQEPETGRPDLEDVLREDRQQRDGAAEEHGEEIERDRAEEDVRPTDEANAGEHLVEPDRALGRGLAPAAQREHAPERDERRARSRRRRRARAGSRRGCPPIAGPTTAESWNAIDRCASALTRISCGTSDGVSARPAGAPIALPTPWHEREREERPDVLGVRRSSPPSSPDEHDDVRATTITASRSPARHAIRQVAGRQREQQQREELREPDQAEVERVLADRVDLPADRDERHLQREAPR